MNENQTVFTTMSVLDHKSPILFVFHDEEDDWQFFGDEELDEDNAAIVSLSQIVELDSSIREILNLQKGFSASRKNTTEKWEVQKI
ncbi:MAG: DUF2185 domain-containing protein [Bacteroidetes bacterium]|nr:DUF2185 domain-containing protein [Bacteroidota bacterium]